MTSFNQIPNSIQLERAYAGTEAIAGVPVDPTFRLYGRLALKEARRLGSRQEYNGTFFPHITPVRGPIEVSGTYEQSLTYEDLAILPRYSMAPGTSPVTDGESTPGYVSAYEPHPTRIAFDTASVESGNPGMPWKADMLYFPEFTISGDTDDAEGAWKWSSRVWARTHDLIANSAITATGGTTSTIVVDSAGWTTNEWQGAYVTLTGGTAGNIGQVREIASNTADTLTLVGALPEAVANADTASISGVFTPSIADRSREAIEAPGTRLYLDDGGGDIGDTPVSEFISFSLTYQGNMAPKRFMENVDTYSARVDQGPKIVTGQVRIEFGSRAEYDHYKNLDVRLIRIAQTGSAIDAGAGTSKHAHLDVYAAFWDDVTMDERANNRTATFAFIGYLDPAEGVPVHIESKHTMSALP